MKFTRSWLADHLETTASIDAIADRLTHIGLEVETVDDKAKALAGFTVAEVLSAAPHPNADKLQVCIVNTGTETVQVVCGAPNARQGLKGVFARPGMTIPGSGLTLSKAKIRGVESSGMLCSERELELSEAHTGIIALPPDAEVGAPAAMALGLDDPVIEIAITPNRGDCLAVSGIARDLAAAGLGRLKTATVEPVAGSFASPIAIALEFDPPARDACPLFAGRLVKGVRNGPSPAWLQHRLRAIGLRPINALVDITNYVSVDRARPLHVYDAAKITGTIRARLGRKGEALLALDGKAYAIDDTMCVIADDKTALGLGGVMGGEASGSTSDTVDVFIESALFDPVRTAATGRALNIQSDARYRFERGVDPLFVVPGLELATRLILEICGGEPSAVVVAGAPPAPRPAIAFTPHAVERLTGLALSDGQITQTLQALGCTVETTKNAGQALHVTPPSWRPDLQETVDLVEEAVRLHGLDHLPSTPLPRLHAVAQPVLTTQQKRERAARRALAARGLVEAVTYSFVAAEHAAPFAEQRKPVKLANPISSELDAMRPSGLPSLLMAAQRNVDRGIGDVGLFEVGPAFSGSTPGAQTLVAAGIRRGNGRPRHWSGAASPVDLLDAKADVIAVLETLGLPVNSLQAIADAPSWYHPGRSGVIRLGPKTVLAHFGVLHPSVLDTLQVKGPVVGFEVFLAAFPEPKTRTTRARPALSLSPFMALERDFAFVVDEAVTTAAVLRAARGADRGLIDAVDIFDVFTGEDIGSGQKSIAITVRLQPRERTLTDDEIEAVAARIVAAVENATGGRLRR